MFDSVGSYIALFWILVSFDGVHLPLVLEHLDKHQGF